MLTLLLYLIVVLVLFWAVRAIMGVLGTPPQIQTVVTVLFVVIVVFWLVSVFLGGRVVVPLR